MAKAITVYETEDGRKFTTMQEAHAYEFAQTRIKNIRRVLANPNLIRAPEGLAIDLFNSPGVLAELREACNKALDYHRRYGKLVGKPNTPEAIKRVMS